MAAAGVIVFTIAYDINDPDVTTLLKSCAPDRYYEPDAGRGPENSQVFTKVWGDPQPHGPPVALSRLTADIVQVEGRRLVDSLIQLPNSRWAWLRQRFSGGAPDHSSGK